MFLRTKDISGKRYIYLAEGKRTGKKVKQKVYYLGPLSKLVYGIPDDLKRKTEAKTPNTLDWTKITENLKKIPFRFTEIPKNRSKQYAIATKAKNIQFRYINQKTNVTPTEIYKQRKEGELLALSKISKKRFQEIYHESENGTIHLKT